MHEISLDTAGGYMVQNKIGEENVKMVESNLY